MTSLQRIERELDGFYKSIDTITLKSAKKLLTGAELKDYKRNINNYLTDNVRDEWKKELLNLKDRYRVSRLQGMQISLRQELEVLGKMELDGITELTKSIYEDNYYHNLYEVTKEMGITKVFDKVDTRKIEMLQQKGWADDDKNFDERIWGRNTKVNNFLQKELTQSIILGKDPQELINTMAKTFKSSKDQAGALILTESAYYASESQHEAYSELDVERYQNIATLDEVTSDICKEMDLSIFKMSEYEINVTAPPFHVRCRTYYIPYFEDNYTERFARSGGKTYTVPSDMSYKEWYSTYVK